MLIGYARVSTDDQHLDLQLSALRGASCEKIYDDRNTGAGLDRPGLGQALDVVREGDVLVVWRLDRLARSLKDLITLSQRLEAARVGLKSLQESIDTSTASGKLFFHIMGALGEFERSLVRERTRAGLDASRRRGRKGGRPRAMTNSDVAAAKALLRDPEITIKEVAKRVGVSPATLYRYLPGGRNALEEIVSHKARERTHAGL